MHRHLSILLPPQLPALFLLCSFGSVPAKAAESYVLEGEQRLLSTVKKHKWDYE